MIFPQIKKKQASQSVFGFMIALSVGSFIFAYAVVITIWKVGVAVSVNG